MAKRYKVNEIFRSLQGEGCHTGVPSTFVRLSGCNLKCPFCDTRHEAGREMTAEEIASEVAALPYSPWIILTGGEPTLQADAALIRLLKSATGSRIAIETNGTRPLPEGIDWVTLSPKDSPVVIDRADEIKVVDLGQPLEGYLTLPARWDDTMLFLQPCYVSNSTEYLDNMQKTVRRILENRGWRLSVQLHRFLNIP